MILEINLTLPSGTLRKVEFGDDGELKPGRPQGALSSRDEWAREYRKQQAIDRAAKDQQDVLGAIQRLGSPVMLDLFNACVSTPPSRVTAAVTALRRTHLIVFCTTTRRYRAA